jgi:hypothetical protein
MFDITTSRDKLRLLTEDHKRLIADPINVSLAEKCCQDAWHLADWDFKEKQNTNTALTKEQYRKELYSQCPEMRILHDLSNTMKHKSVDNPKVKIKQTNIHRGSFSSAFSKAFNVSGLQVIFDNNEQIDVDDLVEIAIDYWTKNLTPI